MNDQLLKINEIQVGDRVQLRTEKGIYTLIKRTYKVYGLKYPDATSKSDELECHIVGAINEHNILSVGAVVEGEALQLRMGQGEIAHVGPVRVIIWTKAYEPAELTPPILLDRREIPTLISMGPPVDPKPTND